MNAQSIRLRPVCEAGNWASNVGEPCRSWRTGILHRSCKHRVLERPLRFAIVVETELIHSCIADRPCMTDVPLLKSLVGD